jgi:hypothetical protein
MTFPGAGPVMTEGKAKKKKRKKRRKRGREERQRERKRERERERERERDHLKNQGLPGLLTKGRESLLFLLNRF